VVRGRNRDRPPSLLFRHRPGLRRAPAALVAENLILRQELIVIRRQIKRPRLRRFDRWLIGALAGRFLRLMDVVLLVKPETVIRLAPYRLAPPNTAHQTAPDTCPLLGRQTLPRSLPPRSSAVAPSLRLRPVGASPTVGGTVCRLSLGWSFCAPHWTWVPGYWL
jgi:hypothetical protein